MSGRAGIDTACEYHGKDKKDGWPDGIIPLGSVGLKNMAIEPDPASPVNTRQNV
ncbi:MAG: hypothetical protein WCK34_05785 [Bacteroidota bacterium]